jgi:hypothetical protein
MAYSIVQRHVEESSESEPEAAGEAQPSQPQEGYDEQAWHDFLAGHLPAWNGSAQTWAQFTEWFQYQADQQGLGSPADSLVAYLDGLSGVERIAAFGQYGVTIPTSAQVSAPGPAPTSAQADAGYDADAWNAFVAEHLTRWDGSAQTWAQFKEWFLYYANTQQLGSPADSLVAHLDGLPVAERIAACAEYGVVIQAPEAAVPSEAAAVPEERGEQAASPSPAVELDEEAESIIAEVLAEDPEFAAIPEERIRELMAEALREAEQEEAEQEDAEPEDAEPEEAGRQSEGEDQ